MRSTLYTSRKNYNDDFTSYPRPFYNFLLMLEGEAEFKISAGKSITVKSGELIWIPKGSTFFARWRVSESGIARWYAIHFDFSSPFNPFLNKVTEPQILNFENPLSILNDFNALSNETNPYLILSVFYRVFAKIFPLIAVRSDSRQKIIRPALDYIELHYKEKLYTKCLASACLLSRSKFQYVFKRIMNMTPIEYKNLLLIQSLQQALLLERDKTLEEISAEYCFNSTAYMCILFKKATGKTPTEYRKTNSLL